MNRGEWRWRESNPRPSLAIGVFSGRSLLGISRPRQSHRQAADQAQSLFDVLRYPATERHSKSPR